MSLDLSNKSGRTHNVAPLVVDGTATADLSGVTIATFDGGDVDSAGKFLLQVGTGVDIDANTLPVTLLNANGAELFEDGTEITITKVSTDANKITFIDPITGISYNYVNRAGESISLIYDMSTGVGRWVAKI